MPETKSGSRQKADQPRPKRKAPRSAWKPGQSGNPAGRRKLTEDQREARAQAQAVIDAHSAEAAWKLTELLESPEARVKLAAAASILDRSGVEGVKRIQIAGEGGGPVRITALREQLAEMLARRLCPEKLDADDEESDDAEGEQAQAQPKKHRDR